MLDKILPLVSTALSVIALALSTYQFLAGARDARINAAIEVSNKSMTDPAIVQMRNDLVDFVSDSVPPADRTHKRDQGQIYFQYLNYVAKLINDGKLDRAYIALSLECQMRNFFENIIVARRIKNPLYADMIPNPTALPDLARLVGERAQAPVCR